MQQKTIPALLYERYRKTPDGIAHYTLDADGKWRPHNWQEYYSDVTRLADGFVNLGLAAGQNIGIMAPASRQWDVVQMAILFCGGVIVGLDPHDAPENIKNIATRAELRGLIVKDYSLLEKIDDALRSKLQFIVLLENETTASIHDEQFTPITDILNKDGLDIETHYNLVREDDPATIIFTSGTTGTPKGIRYNHGQVILACGSILEAFSDISEESRLVCWLPLSNLYQRIINYCAIVVGAATYYVENPRSITQHLPEINPHIFLGVPRFYEKLHAGILENIDRKSPMVKKFARWALKKATEYKKQLRERGQAGFFIKITYQLVCMMTLRRLKNLMGTNLKYMISGSAPISRWLLEQFDGMGFLILEAYGISENVIPIAANRPDSFRFGTVGKPLPGNEIKLAVDGELLVRGSGVFSGYYNDDEINTPLTEDAFLATGDYAQLDDDGFLVLTGRKSEIFKTSTGRRISPVKVETFINRIDYVEHCVIFGAGKPFLVALLSLNSERLRNQQKQIGPDISDGVPGVPVEFFERIKNDVHHEVAELQNYLQPAGLLLTNELFTIEDGELTANLKIRRKLIAEKYRESIDTLYKDIAQNQHTPTSGRGRVSELVVHCL